MLHLPVRIGIVLFAQENPDRRARHVKTIAQVIDNIALIGLRDVLWEAAFYDKTGRARLGLGHIAQPNAPPTGCRWRVVGYHIFQPIIQA